MRLNELVTRAVGWAAGVFFHIEQLGGPIPDGPVLVVANHPNSLLDPLIVFRTAGRATRPLAKAPLFEQAFVGTMLRALGGLPVFRKQDDAALMHRNDETFRLAIAALQAGDAVQIYPEGKSHSEPALAPLRTGAARIALGAESSAQWQLQLKIVPVGLTYERKTLFRGRALAVIGQPFTINGYRERYQADPAEAVRLLTEHMAARLEAVTLNLAQREDQDLLDMAERMYAREKGISSWREREGLAERLPRLQQFARGLAWLRAHDPARHRKLANRVRRYRYRTERLGARAGDVPPRYAALNVLRYSLTQGLALGIGLPLALLGFALWYPAYLAPRIAVRLIRPEYEALATYKLATGIFAVPVLLAIYIVLGWRLAGAVGVAVAAIGLPLVAFIALRWAERWRRVREDAGLFFALLRQPLRQQRLASERAQLVHEFDLVATYADARAGTSTEVNVGPTTSPLRT